MARTQASDYDQKQSAIMSEAAYLFAHRGFSGASISDLAARCGVSKSLIYHYYHSKEAILYEVMHQHMTELMEIARLSNYDLSNPEQAFQDFAKNLLRTYVGGANSQRILLYELSNLPEEQQREIVEMQRRLIDFTEQLLLTVNPRAKGKRKAARTKVMLFFGMMNWTHTWYKEDGELKRDQIAKMAATMTIDAIR